MAVDAVSGDVEQLVKIKFDGTSGDDTLHGKLSEPMSFTGARVTTACSAKTAARTIFGGGGSSRSARRRQGSRRGLPPRRRRGTTIVVPRTTTPSGRRRDVFGCTTIFISDRSMAAVKMAAISRQYQSDILHFSGDLDLTTAAMVGRVTGIETPPCGNGHDGDLHVECR